MIGKGTGDGVSRTIKGQKVPGFEYWTARPGNKCGGYPLGKFKKRQTHKAERKQREAVAERWQE